MPRKYALLKAYQISILLLFSQAAIPAAPAQPPVTLSIKEALQKVQANLAQLEAYRQQSAAAGQNIALAKNSLVPELSAGYQVNMATYNNITGMSYPGLVLPISGPPSQSNELNFVPGTALGALIRWNPFTFGQRNAAIEKATAQYKQANATYNEQLFRFQYAALTIYIEAVYLKQVLKSVQAGIERNNTGLEQSMVLAKNGLRPGIDTSQFQSAIAQAEIDLWQTEQSYRQNIIELTRLTGIADTADELLLTDTFLTHSILPETDTVYSITRHPYYQTLEAQKKSTEADLKEIQRSWAPQLDIWGNVYARGSGVDATGKVNKPDGFILSRSNAGAGLQLSFPVLQFSKVNIRKKQYRSLLLADEARLAQAKSDISKQTATALMLYRQDAKIAGKAPVLLKAARDVYDGLKISYQAGLIDYTQLSQAQYDLVKAEVGEAGSRLQLWRSLLAIAIAKGDLGIFLEQLK